MQRCQGMGSITARLLLGLLLSVRAPTVKQLGAAIRSRDPVQVERIAQRIGTAPLLLLARRGHGEERVWALFSLGLIDNGTALPELVALAEKSARDDLVLAHAALQAAKNITDRLIPQSLECDEIPLDIVGHSAGLLLALASRPTLDTTLRTEALHAVANLQTLGPVDTQNLANLLQSDEPRVRSAAAEALSGVASAEPALCACVAEEEDYSVAVAAAVALCRQVRARGSSRDALTTAANAPKLRARLRAMAQDKSVAVSDRLELLACVRHRATAEDMATLDHIASDSSAAESLRRLARSLGSH